MTAPLLLEILSEEIPARMQRAARKELANMLAEKLKEHGLKHGKIASYVTPRRLAVVVEDVPTVKRHQKIERRGPRSDAPQKAVAGFAAGAGVKLDELEVKKTDKGEFYFAMIVEKEKKVPDLLKESIEGIMLHFPWPKSMRWGNYETRWVRPIQSILCIFDQKVIPVQFGPVTANNKTSGHPFLSLRPFEVNTPEDYVKKVKQHYVVLDQDERKAFILKAAKALAKEKGFVLNQDEDLLEEVTGLVENPVALIGHIEQEFMALPKEVLVTAMRSHQKYFSLHDGNGNLAPYFITISNIAEADKKQKITAGNERVLRARLQDAMFFWQQDRREGLSEKQARLEKIIFHAKLGSVADKTERMAGLSSLFAVWVPRCNLVKAEQAARLSKVDLVTEMVGEFPELQGIMGYYYAQEDNEARSVAEAIKEHYQPVGADDQVPTSPVSIVVALADKIDSLVGLFAIGEKPSGSKDPYALRRAALGVIRIILENNLRIPLRLLFEKSISRYPKALFKDKESEHKKIALLRKKGQSVKNKQEALIESLLQFFLDRLKVILKSESIRHDLIEAVFDGGNEDDFTRLVARVKALSGFVETAEGENLLAAYKRATNIVLAEEKKDSTQYEGNVEENLLKEEAEKTLYHCFIDKEAVLKKYLKEEQFEAAMKEVAELRPQLDDFFEKVVVNDNAAEIRKNRLHLLSQLRSHLGVVANFGKIES